MKDPRETGKRINMYAAFAVAVSSFDDGTWVRIEARCAALEGISPFAVFERAQLRATSAPPKLLFPDTAPLPFRVAAGVFEVVKTGVWTAYELSQLFPDLRKEAPEPRRGGAGKPGANQFTNAMYLLDKALASRKVRRLACALPFKQRRKPSYIKISSWRRTSKQATA